MHTWQYIFQRIISKHKYDIIPVFIYFGVIISNPSVDTSEVSYHLPGERCEPTGIFVTRDFFCFMYLFSAITLAV